MLNIIMIIASIPLLIIHFVIVFIFVSTMIKVFSDMGKK